MKKNKRQKQDLLEMTKSVMLHWILEPFQSIYGRGIITFLIPPPRWDHSPRNNGMSPLIILCEKDIFVKNTSPCISYPSPTPSRNIDCFVDVAC